MSFGLPTIATEVGHTPKIIRHNINGWLVKSAEDWSYALETLIKNPELRRKLGEEARETVLARFSSNVIKSNYLSILKSTSKDRP